MSLSFKKVQDYISMYWTWNIVNFITPRNAVIQTNCHIFTGGLLHNQKPTEQLKNRTTAENVPHLDTKGVREPSLFILCPKCYKFSALDLMRLHKKNRKVLNPESENLNTTYKVFQWKGASNIPETVKNLQKRRNKNFISEGEIFSRNFQWTSNNKLLQL